MKKSWTPTQLIALGALAALYVVLSIPGAVLAGITGIPMFSAIGNIVIIGIMYPLLALLFKRIGAVTLWAFIVGMLFIPFPLAGPPGFLLKVVYITFWGVVADITYLFFRRSEKLSAIAIGAIQIGLGVPLTILIWTLLGAPELAKQAVVFSGTVFIFAGFIAGGVLGYIAYLIYNKLKNTTIVKRIQA